MQFSHYYDTLNILSIALKFTNISDDRHDHAKRLQLPFIFQRL